MLMTIIISISRMMLAAAVDAAVIAIMCIRLDQI